VGKLISSFNVPDSEMHISDIIPLPNIADINKPHIIIAIIHNNHVLVMLVKNNKCVATFQHPVGTTRNVMLYSFNKRQICVIIKGGMILWDGINVSAHALPLDYMMNAYVENDHFYVSREMTKIYV